MQLQRQTTYYIVILFLPCFSNVMLTLLVFLLPTETGERIGVGINTLFIMWVNYLRVNITSPQCAYIFSKLCPTNLQICSSSRSVLIVSRWTPKNWCQQNFALVGIWKHLTFILAMIFLEKSSLCVLFIPGGGILKKLIRGSSAPRSDPLLVYIPSFWQKRYPFRIPSIDKWYPFRISSIKK